MSNNEYININKINQKPVETVYELKEDEYKVPSFKEFMKDYQEEKRIIDSYELEVDSYKDIRVEKKFRPMPFRRDIINFIIDFQGANHYLYEVFFDMKTEPLANN